jgi:hypothetical protein
VAGEGVAMEKGVESPPSIIALALRKDKSQIRPKKAIQQNKKESLLGIELKPFGLNLRDRASRLSLASRCGGICLGTGRRKRLQRRHFMETPGGALSSDRSF